jgi:hypothetical protein
MKNGLLSILVLGTFASLISCAESQPSAAPSVRQTFKSADVSAEDVVGMWTPEDNFDDSIMIDAHFEDDNKGVVTKLTGLNLQREFGYTFLYTGSEDELVLEVNPDTNEIQALARKPLQKGAVKVFKIVARLISSTTLEIESTVAGQKSRRTYTKQPNFEIAKVAFLKTQKVRSLESLNEEISEVTPRCRGAYDSLLMVRNTACLKVAVDFNPALRLRGETLSKMVRAANSEMVAYLLADNGTSKGMDPNLKNASGGSILEDALRSGTSAYGIPHHGFVATDLEKADIIRLLVNAGAELNPKYGDPILTLASKGHVDADVIDLMIDKGARYSPDTGAFEQGLVFLFIGFKGDWISQGLPLIEKLIRVAGANVKTNGGSGYGGLLSQAALNAPVDVLKVLAANGAQMKGQGAIEECEKEIQSIKTRLVTPRKLSQRDQQTLSAKIAELQTNIAYLKTF